MRNALIAKYLCHSKCNSFKKNLSNTIKIIEKNPESGVAVSWGKDSIVLLDIVYKSLGKAKAVHARYSMQEELPDIPYIRDAYLKIRPDIEYHEVPVFGSWEIFREIGYFFLSSTNKKQREMIKKQRETLISSVEDKLIYLGCDSKMVGIASHESYGRMMNVRTRGNTYKPKNEKITKILPLAFWSKEDIFAYALTNDLPLLKIYHMSENPERARSEIAFAEIGDKSAQALMRYGVWNEWIKTYPEFMAVWIKEYPEILKLMK